MSQPKTPKPPKGFGDDELSRALRPSPIMDVEDAAWADAQAKARKLVKRWVQLGKPLRYSDFSQCAIELSAAFKL